MSLYERMKLFWEWEFVREDQLRQFVQLEKLSKEEFEEITGIEFDEEPVDPDEEENNDPSEDEEEPLEDEDGDYPINPS